MNKYTQDHNNKKINDNLLRTLYPNNIIEQNPSPPSMSNTQDIDSVSVQIENAVSGKILGREIFKKDSSIQQIKTQVKEVIMNYINHPIYKLEFFKDLPDKRIKLNDKQILDELSYSDPIYKVFYKVGSHLMNLLDSYKTEDLEWDWNYLSGNPNITIDFIENNLKTNDPFPWSLEGMSQNPNLNMNFIINHPF